MSNLPQSMMSQAHSVIATPGPSGLATPRPSNMSTPAPIIPGMLPPGTPGMMQPPTPVGILPPGTPGMEHNMMYPQTPGYPVPSSSLHMEDMPHLQPDQVFLNL